MRIKTATQPDSAFKDILLVPRECEEWDVMWKKLSVHPLNKGLNDPCDADYGGECWQYMESIKRWFGLVHRFRHRLHPGTKKRECIEIRASKGFEIEPNP